MTVCRPSEHDRHARVVPGRHADQPDHHPAHDCPGCAPCPEAHCRVDHATHVTGPDTTCAECVALARDNLHEIARLCGSLPDEVEARGVDSEAMMLLAPSTNPERWGHAAASALGGRVIPAGCDATELDDLEAWLARADHDTHPTWVLGQWDMQWRADLDHDHPNPDGPFDLKTAVAYLDQQLTYMATYPLTDFRGFANALKRCRTHIERVLHADDYVQAGAPCLKCHVKLERLWAVKDNKDDGWQCPRCKEFIPDARYGVVVAADLIEHGTHLTAVEMEAKFANQFAKPLTAGRVRVWGSRGHVRKQGVNHEGRILYSVDDTLARATAADDTQAS